MSLSKPSTIILDAILLNPTTLKLFDVYLRSVLDDVGLRVEIISQITLEDLRTRDTQHSITDLVQGGKRRTNLEKVIRF